MTLRTFARAASLAASATAPAPAASSTPIASPLSRHYARLSSLWPKDRLRPDTSFVNHVLDAREKQATSPAEDALSSQTTKSPAQAFSQQKELCQINALYALVDNRFSKKYPVSHELLRPTFKPTYYEELLRDFEAAPSRQWWQLWALKFKGMFRWK